MSSEDEGQFRRMLDDRIEFKLYAAEQHLNRLKEIENVYGDIAKYNARIEVEMEVDCFLFQVMEAVDSLLFLINDELELGIPAEHVNFVNVQSGLSSKTKKIDLLSPLDKARQQGNWYYGLSQMRNQLVHGTFLKKEISVYDFKLKLRQVRLVNLLNVPQEFEEGSNQFDRVIDMELIQYLEKILQQVRQLIHSIRASDPFLQ